MVLWSGCDGDAFADFATAIAIAARPLGEGDINDDGQIRLHSHRISDATGSKHFFLGSRIAVNIPKVLAVGKDIQADSEGGHRTTVIECVTADGFTSQLHRFLCKINKIAYAHQPFNLFRFKAGINEEM